jgi:hypothetical protein
MPHIRRHICAKTTPPRLCLRTRSPRQAKSRTSLGVRLCLQTSVSITTTAARTRLLALSLMVPRRVLCFLQISAPPSLQTTRAALISRPTPSPTIGRLPLLESCGPVQLRASSPVRPSNMRTAYAILPLAPRPPICHTRCSQARLVFRAITLQIAGRCRRV